MSKFLLSPEINHPDLTGVDIAVWHGLSSFAQWEFDDNGMPVKSKPDSCFPSINKIAEKTRFSMATVCRSLHHLENLGYIKRLKGGGSHKSTRYILISKFFKNYDYQKNVDKLQNIDLELHSHEKLSHIEREWHHHGEKLSLCVSKLSQCDNKTLSQRETNIPYNKTINTEKEKEKKGSVEKIFKKRMGHKKPLDNVPYDIKAFQVITDMYYICVNYTPDAPAEIRLLQDLHDEYPDVNLFREFRKALDWLENVDLERRPSNLHRFLRNWTENANTKNALRVHNNQY